MKIAITAEQPTAESAVSPRFGRTPHLVIYDTDAETFTPMDNTANADLGQAAGIQTAQAVADAGVEVLITGRVGPKAADVLNAANIRVVFCESGRVDQAVQDFLDGKGQPQPADAAPGQPGQGMGQGQGMGRGMGRGMGGGGRCGQGRGMGGQGRGMGGRGMGGGNPGRGRGGVGTS